MLLDDLAVLAMVDPHLFEPVIEVSEDFESA
jgi:hypothetical protein